MAPEIVRREEYEGKATDIWSLGILLYTMLCGKFPFSGPNYNELYRRIIKGAFLIPPEVPKEAQRLLRAILVNEPSNVGHCVWICLVCSAYP